MKTKVLFIVILAIAFSAVATAQKEKSSRIAISGIVLTEEGQPVSGASIFIDEVDTNIKTNNKGVFKYKIHPDAKSIIALKPDVGIIGLVITDTTEYRMVLDKKKFVLLMEKDPNDDEVEVGYRAIKKKYLTTPSSTVNTTNPKYASYASIYEMLQGEVPGVQVNGNSIIIRGVGSIANGTQPLFVVDGIQVSSVSHVTPSTVVSIEVLKGSSATIYGAKGSNGVILIKTRSR